MSFSCENLRTVLTIRQTLLDRNQRWSCLRSSGDLPRTQGVGKKENGEFV